MITKYKYIHFEQIPVPDQKKKTTIWRCLNNKSLGDLGLIKWYGPWRQYCFLPANGTIFNKGCLEDINDFITQLMEERKK